MTQIGTDTFALLDDLSKGQDKEWFNNNRLRYQTHLLEPMRELVRSVSAPLCELIDGLETRPTVNKTLTRINRDMRFTRPGESPYKDHMLALFYREGRKKLDPQLFIGLQPGEAWIGVYMGEYHLSDRSPIAAAIATDPRSVLKLGKAVGIGDDLVLARCDRFGEISEQLDGSDPAHYRAGPHLCALGRCSADQITADPDVFINNATTLLERLVPLWQTYAETRQ